ncbi:MAG: cysteine-rich small domain-containing protein [Anaerovoracaceae bacterium]
MEHFKWFQNKECEYYPCHSLENFKNEEDFNCLFCFCPIYSLGRECGGNYEYTEDGIKDCSNCLITHDRNNYEFMLSKTKELVLLVKE